LNFFLFLSSRYFLLLFFLLYFKTVSISTFTPAKFSFSFLSFFGKIFLFYRKRNEKKNISLFFCLLFFHTKKLEKSRTGATKQPFCSELPIDMMMCRKKGGKFFLMYFPQFFAYVCTNVNDVILVRKISVSKICDCIKQSFTSDDGNFERD